MVDEVLGRPPRLPADLGAIAETLAAIHALAVPPSAGRAPLPDPADPFGATLAQIDVNAAFLAAAGLAEAAHRQIADELIWARDFARDFVPHLGPCPRALTVADAHPGNFLVTADGVAWFVDLEKAQYGCPAIDLAHATLRPATLWDRDSACVLARSEVADFYAQYLARRGAAAATALGPWLAPLRRLTWLRTTTAFARFAAEGTARLLAPDRAAHAEAAIAQCLETANIASMRAEWLAREGEPSGGFTF